MNLVADWSQHLIEASSSMTANIDVQRRIRAYLGIEIRQYAPVPSTKLETQQGTFAGAVTTAAPLNMIPKQTGSVDTDSSVTYQTQEGK